MKTQIGLFVVVLLLFSIGAIMVFNTTSAEMIDKEVYAIASLSMLKQILFAAFGSGVGYSLYLIGYQNLIKYSHILFIGTTILLLAVFIPKVGMQINGAYRWINVFGISLQPSEFMKMTLPLLFLKLFFKGREKLSFATFFKWQCILLIPIVLIIVEPDNGTAAILLTTCVVSYFITRIRWSFWVIPIIIVLIGAATAAISMKHVSDRIHIYLHPEADLLGKGHQPYQAKIAAGSGGVLGRGLGESLQKLNYLPEARSDYIAAIYAEEFGFVGVLFLLVLYLLIATFGFQIAIRSRDEAGYYLATIFTFIICFQAFLNLGVVSGILPSKGTNLPFFSQGGSSLLANIFLLATLMNVDKGVKTVCERKLR